MEKKDAPVVDVKKIIGTTNTPYRVTLSQKDLILYALGIGFQQDLMNRDHYNFTYENHENFGAFPTIPVVIAHRGPASKGDFSFIPGLPPFNPMMLLHGDETVEMLKPIQADEEYEVVEKVIDFQDKVKGAVLIFQTTISSVETKEVHAKVIMSCFIRGLGGFGYKGTVKLPFPKMPKRAPDAISEDKTQSNQAFLYRLCNDMNPLHVDPDMAAMGGFDKPILHGLCFFGFTAKAVQQKYFNENPESMPHMSARFTSVVFPGETLIVEMWKEADAIVFQTKTKERGKQVLVGYVKLDQKAKL
mmetsp:Transcript_111461/g.154025  ORF Transcript_111461/g.154025 Transcript_111461/m.154025 type:complete len:302 (-) Transcript_111461:63-968(-)